MVRFARGFALLCILAMIPGIVFAVIPDPSQSSTPKCIRVSPNGGSKAPPNQGVLWPEFNALVTVVGTDGLPMNGVAVRAIFQDLVCTGSNLVTPCNAGIVQPYPVVSGVTDAQGRVFFRLWMGGCCHGSTPVVEIQADPGATTLKTYVDIASPDSNGDLVVDVGDFVRFQQAFDNVGTTPAACTNYADNPPTDPCDGNTDIGDFALFQSAFNRFAHYCTAH